MGYKGGFRARREVPAAWESLGAAQLGFVYIHMEMLALSPGFEILV